MGEKRTAVELIAELKAKVAMTDEELALELRRDVATVGRVASGEESGEEFVAALTELSCRGSLARAPELVAELAGKTSAGVEKPKRRRRAMPVWEETCYLESGGRFYSRGIPARASKAAQSAVWQWLYEKLQALAQRTGGDDYVMTRRVILTLDYSTGQRRSPGPRYGYDLWELLDEVHARGGDLEAWVMAQQSGAYVTADHSQSRLIGVQANVLSPGWGLYHRPIGPVSKVNWGDSSATPFT